MSYMKYILKLNDGSRGEYACARDVQDAILEAHAEGIGVNSVENMFGDFYSLIWSVFLQKEN